MQNTPLKDENPFEYVSRVVSNDDGLNTIKTLMKHYLLSHLEAKSVWLSCPEFQERLCRHRISASKARGGSEYGNKMYLRRRYKLEEEELDFIFEELWVIDKANTSQRFLNLMSPLRIAEGHLTDSAQSAVEKLINYYGSDSKVSN